MKYADMKTFLGLDYYANHFWNYVKNKQYTPTELDRGSVGNGAYAFPAESEGKYDKAVAKRNPMRKICTVQKNYDGASEIYAFDSDPDTKFLPEGAALDINDVDDCFTRIPMHSHKLASVFRAPDEFIHDAAFDLEDYMLRTIANSFAKAEEKAFIKGTGTNEPTGILNNVGGAAVGVTAAANAVTFDKVLDLFFSSEPGIMENGVWLMHPSTMLYLRELKDGDGNYMWREPDGKLCGKEVYLSEAMPEIEAGKKPIAFGDFSFYWILDRSPLSVRMLKETFAPYGQTGFLAHKFLDGKLIYPEAIKVLKINA